MSNRVKIVVPYLCVKYDKMNLTNNNFKRCGPKHHTSCFAVESSNTCILGFNTNTFRITMSPFSHI